MTLIVKNMVCPRCIAAVERIFERMRIPVRSVVLGEAVVDGELSAADRACLAARLSEAGFELLEDRRSQSIEAVKCALIERVSGPLPLPEGRLSDYLTRRLHRDYNYLSTLFSETYGRTIEHYYILLKIERAKELLVYGESTLAEIAFLLGYSSTAHLSAQFKRMTGLTPSAYRRSPVRPRRSLDDL